MMSRKWTGLVALVLSGVAQAGPYVGGSGLISERENYEDLERAHGAKAFVGYRFDEAPLMLELGYLDAGEAEAADTGGMTLGYSGLLVTAGWFGKLSPTGSGVWLKGGYYNGDSEVKDPAGFVGAPGATYTESASGLAVGLGGDWKFTRWVGLRFELEGLIGVKDFANDENLTAYSLGLVFEIPTDTAPAPVARYLPPPPAAPAPAVFEPAQPQPLPPAEPVPTTAWTPPPAATTQQDPLPAAVAQPEPVLVATVPASAPAAAWLPGSSARATRTLTLRKRPLTSAEAGASVPTGAALELLGRQNNAEGTWWLVSYQGERGWAPQASLTP